MSRTFLLSLLLTALVVVGCNSTTPESDPAPAAPTATPVASSATATPVPMPTLDARNTELGEPQRIEGGGFSFRPIPGYTLDVDEVSVSMQAPDASEVMGPGFFLTGGRPEDYGIASDDEAAVETLLQQFVSSLVPDDPNNVVLEEPRRVARDQTPGLDQGFTVFGEQPRRGRVTVLQRDDGQLFIMVGLSHPERWDPEIKLLYRSILDDLDLFEIGG